MHLDKEGGLSPDQRKPGNPPGCTRNGRRGFCFLREGRERRFVVRVGKERGFTDTYNYVRVRPCFFKERREKTPVLKKGKEKDR